MKNRLLKICLSLVLMLSATAVVALAETNNEDINIQTTDQNPIDETDSDIENETPEEVDDESGLEETENEDNDKIEDLDKDKSETDDNTNVLDESDDLIKEEQNQKIDSIEELAPKASINFERRGTRSVATVNTLDELNLAIAEATEESTILLSETFNMSELDKYALKTPHAFTLELDGNNRVFEGILKVQSGTVKISNLIIDGQYSGQEDRINVGLSIEGSTQNTVINNLIIRNSKTGLSV